MLRMATASTTASAVSRPAASPPRSFRVPSGDPIQIAHVGDSPDGAAQTGALRELAGSAAASVGWGPFRVDPLPASIGYAQALRLPRRGEGALAGVGGDELAQVRLSAPVVLVLGQPGSGRSTALAVMVRSLAGVGRDEVLVITPRRSRLPELCRHRGPGAGARLRRAPACTPARPDAAGPGTPAAQPATSTTNPANPRTTIAPAAAPTISTASASRPISVRQTRQRPPWTA